MAALAAVHEDRIDAVPVDDGGGEEGDAEAIGDAADVEGQTGIARSGERPCGATRAAYQA